MEPQNRLDRLRSIPLEKAAALLSVSKRTLHRLIAAGKFPRPIKVGNSPRVRVVELEQYMERLEQKRAQ